MSHFTEGDELACIDRLRELLSFMPGNNTEDPPVRPTQDPADRAEPALDSLVPLESNKPYDIKKIIQAVVDDDHFLEVHKDYAKNIVIGFARFDGRPVGIVANQPGHRSPAASTSTPRSRRRGSCGSATVSTSRW